MAATVRITYYGMEGEGKTLTEAKRDAGRKVEMALEGSYTPKLLGQLDSFHVIIWREPNGWSYKLLNGDPVDATKTYTYPEGLYGCQGDSSYEDTLRSARRHLAQVAVDVSYLEDQQDINSWHRNRRCQDAYKAARAEGKTDAEAHEIMCNTR